MKDELRQKLMADAQARGIDINAIPGMMPPQEQGVSNMEFPEMTQSDLVSYVQSISDGIINASDADIVDMIKEIVTIRKTGGQEETMEQGVPSLEDGDNYMM